MLLDQNTVDVPQNAHLGRWFLAFGMVGIVAAVLLAIAIGNDSVSFGLVAALWPAAPMMIVDPRTLGDKILVGLVTYGSNFLIYGLAGMLIGFCSNRLLGLRRR